MCEYIAVMWRLLKDSILDVTGTEGTHPAAA